MKFALACLVAALAIGSTSCHKAGRDVRPVSLPDLSRADPAVQQQARELYSSLTEKIRSRDTPPADLAAAYGKLGMVLQAAEYYDAAEPCYLNAQTLAPGEVRWPYFLGHMYTDKGKTEQAEVSFKRALELQPDDLAIHVWLGRLYFDEGRAEDAEPMFAKARARDSRSVAALAGLGRVALARRDYAQAAKHLEAALAIDPEADSLHAPLAQAYRGLGQVEKAEPHLRQWKNREIFVADPLRQELDLVLESGLSYELRGIRALEAQDWTAATTYFRKGLALAQANSPLRRSLHHKLGTVLFMSGDVRGASEQFEEVVRLAPESGVDESAAKGHYSLGVLMASSGRTPEALAHFSAAVKYQPSYVEARLGLADALRRSGRVEASLGEYKEALTLNPRTAEARLGYAMALVRLLRYQAAVDWLTDATTRQPDRPELAIALARLLAAAPDDRVRDGQRAITITQELFKDLKSTDLGETMAMALAEVGEYDKAAAVQRGVMDAAQRAGLNEAVARMAENLRLYEHGRPCRTPWKDDIAVALPAVSPYKSDR
jgi:tetratricopeptide (TPR) repeat protein